MIAQLTPIADWLVVVPVVLGLMGGALLLVLRSRLRLQQWLCLVVLLAIFGSDAALLQRVLAEGPIAMTMGRWLPPFGITFVADVLGAGFAMAAAFVAIVVLAYLQMDTPETARRDGIYPLVLLLVAGVSGAFLTGDIFNLYVWFEVILISTFGLMALAGNPLQIDGVVKYGLLNFLATSLFLLALGLLYGLLGTLNMADIMGKAQGADSTALVAIAALLTLAFATKAAAFPVNAWLPASYHTPPAGIAALIAGLLTKVGAYALIRILPFMLPGARAVLEPALVALAAITMVLGPLGAIAETKARRIFGFILIGGIGVIISGIAMPSIAAVSGAVLYVVHAILTITALYLIAGLIERSGGQLAESWRRTLLSALLLAMLLSAAGIPPFFGFWPKLLLLQGLLDDGRILHDVNVDWRALILVGAILINAFLTLIAGARLWIRLFWKEPASVASEQPRLGLGLGATAFLSCTIIGVGLWPNGLVAAAQLAAMDLLDPAVYVHAVGLGP
ncbi:MAG: proton-conducting transporter membrane subunit [Devosia sp.]